MRQATVGAVLAVFLVAAVSSANASPGRVARDRAPAPAAPGGGGIVLYFDEVAMGFATAAEGCLDVALVETRDDGVFQSKDVTGTELPGCTVAANFAMVRTLKQWLRNQLSGRNTTRNVAIVRPAIPGQPAGAVKLADANLVGLALQSLDAGSQTNLVLELTFAAPHGVPADAADYPTPPVITNPQLKRSMFRLSVDDTLVAQTTGISSIKLTRSFDGSELGPWVVKDVSVAMRLGSAPMWDKWYDGVVGNVRSDERIAKVELLKSNQTIGATFTLGGFSVISNDDYLDLATDGVPLRKFRAYAETVELLIP